MVRISGIRAPFGAALAAGILVLPACACHPPKESSASSATQGQHTGVEFPPGNSSYRDAFGYTAQERDLENFCISHHDHESVEYGTDGSIQEAKP